LAVTIIGIGNILLQDEGVGVHALNRLMEGYELPDSVNLIDGGTMGLDLLPFVEGSERILFIDAVDFRKEPGSIGIIEDEELPAIVKTKVSPHQIGLSDLLSVLKLLEKGPKSIAVIGIQPERIQTGTELSDTIRGRIDDLLNAIIEKLRQWGIEVKEKDVSRCPV
jgi:hydrogenase maturation protease